MIFGNIKDAETYLGMGRNLDTALRYMMETDFSALEDGRHAIDGDNVFVNVMCAQTKADKQEYEFHEHYYDIQIDISGAEDIHFSSVCQEITQPYDGAGDIGMGSARSEAVCHLEPGKFAICEPKEPHLPGVAAEGREIRIRKAVIKVHK